VGPGGGDAGHEADGAGDGRARRIAEDAAPAAAQDQLESHEDEHGHADRPLQRGRREQREHPRPEADADDHGGDEHAEQAAVPLAPVVPEGEGVGEVQERRDQREGDRRRQDQAQRRREDEPDAAADRGLEKADDERRGAAARRTANAGSLSRSPASRARMIA
jgi:hypothetical protein